MIFNIILINIIFINFIFLLTLFLLNFVFIYITFLFLNPYQKIFLHIWTSISFSKINLLYVIKIVIVKHLLKYKLENFFQINLFSN